MSKIGCILLSLTLLSCASPFVATRTFDLPELWTPQTAPKDFAEAPAFNARDPWAGGILIFKLRRRPEVLLTTTGRESVGSPSFDAKLKHFGAHAFAAFPIELGELRDRAGLARWAVIHIPDGINLYQAASVMRKDPDIYPESMVYEDAEFLRAFRMSAWPAPFPSTPENTATRPANIKFTTPAKLPQELTRIEAPLIWSRQRGAGVRIAIIDSGVDTNHVAIAPNLKDGSRGVNLAHLALAQGMGLPEVGLGLTHDLSDWSGQGTAIASLAAGSGYSGSRIGVAPDAEILIVDTEENLRITESRLLEEDPRMRSTAAKLHSPTWSRALGVVYAVTEGARVLTCAWPKNAHLWVLHDVLLFAEDNCVVPVCSESVVSEDVVDIWTGERKHDFYRRELRGVVHVGQDLTVPSPGGFKAAKSSPKNDGTPMPDHRHQIYKAPEVAVGPVAGAAALLVADRPDLEPYAIREVLRSGARDGELWLPGAWADLGSHAVGSCGRRPAPMTADREWWKRVNVRAKMRQPGGDVPASPGW